MNNFISLSLLTILICQSLRQLSPEEHGGVSHLSSRPQQVEPFAWVPPTDTTAGAESIFVSLWLSHLGQAGLFSTWMDCLNNSKIVPHSWHLYSYIGICICSACHFAAAFWASHLVTRDSLLMWRASAAGWAYTFTTWAQSFAALASASAASALSLAFSLHINLLVNCNLS